MILSVTGDGWLHWPDGRVRCAIGRTGIRADKREGDGATPQGAFPLRHVLYRPDREAAPVTALPVRAIEPDDGWCDDPGHPAYNLPVKLPFSASHEILFRDDGLYDLVVILGHNDDPPVPFMGSAVFMHVARDDWGPTAGCVSLSRTDLRKILSLLGPGDSIRIGP